MDCTGVKVLVLVGLFIATYAFALLPIIIMKYANATNNASRRSSIERGISYMSCLAAGVFLGTCLLDLYPEVEEKMVEAMSTRLSAHSMFKDYPFGESVMVVGFFLVLIVEQIVLSIKERHNQQQQLTSLANGKKQTSYDAVNSSESDPLLNGRAESQVRTRTYSTSSTKSLNTIHSIPVGGANECDTSVRQDLDSYSPIRSFMMLAALSLHSVFEGLAVGLQDTVSQVMSIFGALILHKCIIAFSIGLNLVQSKLSVKAIISSNAVFCIASPIGIAIGILIDEYTDPSSALLANGILQGIACGTFLYVTFFEVLPHEFNKPNDRIMKLLFVVFGFIIVNGIIFLELYLTNRSS